VSSTVKFGATIGAVKRRSQLTKLSLPIQSKTVMACEISGLRKAKPGINSVLSI
jgi:hypothetical protein